MCYKITASIERLRRQTNESGYRNGIKMDDNNKLLQYVSSHALQLQATFHLIHWSWIIIVALICFCSGFFFTYLLLLLSLLLLVAIFWWSRWLNKLHTNAIWLRGTLIGCSLDTNPLRGFGRFAGVTVTFHHHSVCWATLQMPSLQRLVLSASLRFAVIRI